MQDYPSSLKNLNKTTRKKAIDIANALVDEGYDDNRAIPIATEQAKEWYENASNSEREDFLKNEDPTKRKTNQHSRPELLDDIELVIPHENNQWAVQSKRAKKPAKIFDNKEDAIEYGKSIAENKKTGLQIQKKDGSIQDEINYEQ